uniref:Ig-like domain-containing protein n=1 Tax=Fundulus heteroclitus TaxID=8078 RepID=A0A3Q2PVX1_FUNHE
MPQNFPQSLGSDIESCDYMFFIVVSMPTVTLQHNWSEIFRGETVTLRCEIQGGGGAQWTYEWSSANRKSPSSSEYRINTATESYSGDYYCRARRGSEQTDWSSVFRLTVRCESDYVLVFMFASTADKPRATMTTENTVIPAGGSVALRCSVSSSGGWKFDWFRQESVSSPAQLIRTNEPDGVLRVSEGGVYSCRGGRGDPAFYTETSTEVTIQETGELLPDRDPGTILACCVRGREKPPQMSDPRRWRNSVEV